MPLPQIELLYLGTDDRYRIKKGRIQTEWPRLVLNNGDEQAHTLLGKPMFYKTDPLLCTTWDELLEADPTPVLLKPPRRLRVVTESENFWPVGLRDVDPSAKLRHLLEVKEEATRFAKERGAKDTAKQGLLGLGFMCIVGAIAFLTVIMGVIVITKVVL